LPDSDDELHHQSRRRSRKFSLHGLKDIASISSIPDTMHKGVEHMAASGCTVR
jgi:hypothetical protein